MMTIMKKQKTLKIICHIIFTLGLFWCFRFYSFLRPASYGAIYKEYLSALVLLLLLYVNYLVFIPKFYLKRNYNVFMILSPTSVLIATVIEMFLVTPNITSCLPAFYTEQEIRNCILMHTFFVGFRNLAFLLFFFVLRIFENERETLEKERIAFAKDKGFICVPGRKETIVTISISDISYIIHNRNYTFIHTLDGKEYTKYISLSNMVNILPDTQFLRINRNTIIPISEIVRYTENNITISYGNPAQEKTFTLSEKYVPDMKSFLASVGGLNRINGGLNHACYGLNDGTNKSNLEEFMDNIAHDENLFNLCYIIAKEPSVTTKSLSEKLQVPLRTIERKIKYLKDKDVIQHSGAKKKGEYVFAPSISADVINWLTSDERSATD